MRLPSLSSLALNGTASEALKTLTTVLGFQTAAAGLVSPVLPNVKIQGRAQPDVGTADSDDEPRSPVYERARPNFTSLKWSGIHVDAEKFFLAAYELSAGGLYSYEDRPWDAVYDNVGNQIYRSAQGIARSYRRDPYGYTDPNPDIDTVPGWMKKNMAHELKIIFGRLETLVLTARNQPNESWAWTADAFVEAAIESRSQKEFYEKHKDLKPVDFDPSGDYLQNRFQAASLRKRTPRAVPKFDAAEKPFWANDFEAAWLASPNGYQSWTGGMRKTPDDIIWSDTAQNTAGVLVSTGKLVANRAVIATGGNVIEMRRAVDTCYEQISRICEAKGYEMSLTNLAFIKGATIKTPLSFYTGAYQVLWKNGKGQSGPPIPKENWNPVENIPDPPSYKTPKPGKGVEPDPKPDPSPSPGKGKGKEGKDKLPSDYWENDTNRLRYHQTKLERKAIRQMQEKKARLRREKEEKIRKKKKEMQKKENKRLKKEKQEKEKKERIEEEKKAQEEIDKIKDPKEKEEERLKWEKEKLKKEKERMKKEKQEREKEEKKAKKDEEKERKREREEKKRKEIENKKSPGDQDIPQYNPKIPDFNPKTYADQPIGKSKGKDAEHRVRRPDNARRSPPNQSRKLPSDTLPLQTIPENFPLELAPPVGNLPLPQLPSLPGISIPWIDPTNTLSTVLSQVGNWPYWGAFGATSVGLLGVFGAVFGGIFAGKKKWKEDRDRNRDRTDDDIDDDYDNPRFHEIRNEAVRGYLKKMSDDPTSAWAELETVDGYYSTIEEMTHHSQKVALGLEELDSFGDQHMQESLRSIMGSDALLKIVTSDWASERALNFYASELGEETWDAVCQISDVLAQRDTSNDSTYQLMVAQGALRTLEIAVTYNKDRQEGYVGTEEMINSMANSLGLRGEKNLWDKVHPKYHEAYVKVEKDIAAKRDNPLIKRLMGRMVDIHQSGSGGPMVNAVGKRFNGTIPAPTTTLGTPLTTVSSSTTLSSPSTSTGFTNSTSPSITKSQTTGTAFVTSVASSVTATSLTTGTFSTSPSSLETSTSLPNGSYSTTMPVPTSRSAITSSQGTSSVLLSDSTSVTSWWPTRTATSVSWNSTMTESEVIPTSRSSGTGMPGNPMPTSFPIVMPTTTKSETVPPSTALGTGNSTMASLPTLTSTQSQNTSSSLTKTGIPGNSILTPLPTSTSTSNPTGTRVPGNSTVNSLPTLTSIQSRSTTSSLTRTGVPGNSTRTMPGSTWLTNSTRTGVPGNSTSTLFATLTLTSSSLGITWTSNPTGTGLISSPTYKTSFPSLTPSTSGITWSHNPTGTGSLGSSAYKTSFPSLTPSTSGITWSHNLTGTGTGVSRNFTFPTLTLSRQTGITWSSSPTGAGTGTGTGGAHSTLYPTSRGWNWTYGNGTATTFHRVTQPTKIVY